jgi:hypothetical protein
MRCVSPAGYINRWIAIDFFDGDFLKRHLQEQMSSVWLTVFLLVHFFNYPARKKTFAMAPSFFILDFWNVFKTFLLFLSFALVNMIRELLGRTSQSTAYKFLRSACFNFQQVSVALLVLESTFALFPQKIETKLTFLYILFFWYVCTHKWKKWNFNVSNTVSTYLGTNFFAPVFLGETDLSQPLRRQIATLGPELEA